MIVSPKPPPPPSFSQLVEDVEFLALTHPGLAKRTVLLALGDPQLDRFQHGWLDRALRRVHESSEVGRVAARVELTRTLSMLSARTEPRVSA